MDRFGSGSTPQTFLKNFIQIPLTYETNDNDKLEILDFLIKKGVIDEYLTRASICLPVPKEYHKAPHSYMIKRNHIDRTPTEYITSTVTNAFEDSQKKEKALDILKQSQEYTWQIKTIEKHDKTNALKFENTQP